MLRCQNQDDKLKWSLHEISDPITPLNIIWTLCIHCFFTIMNNNSCYMFLKAFYDKKNNLFILITFNLRKEKKSHFNKGLIYVLDIVLYDIKSLTWYKARLLFLKAKFLIKIQPFLFKRIFHCWKIHSFFLKLKSQDHEMIILYCNPNTFIPSHLSIKYPKISSRHWMIYFALSIKRV